MCSAPCVDSLSEYGNSSLSDHDGRSTDTGNGPWATGNWQSDGGSIDNSYNDGEWSRCAALILISYGLFFLHLYFIFYNLINLHRLYEIYWIHRCAVQHMFKRMMGIIFAAARLIIINFISIFAMSFTAARLNFYNSICRRIEAIKFNDQFIHFINIHPNQDKR